MCGPRRFLAPLLSLAILGTSGCGGPSKRTLTASEPPLAAVPGDAEVVAAAPSSAGPSRAVSFVDRHPLFSKPKQYYDSTNKNKAVKTAAAAVVGVPAGIYGELKQIVVGAPQAN